MYSNKYVKGAMSIGDFIRLDAGTEILYEVKGGDASVSMGNLQTTVSRAKAKTAMQKLLLVDDKNLTVTPVIRVTLITPAAPKQQSGVKKGAKWSDKRKQA